MDDFLSRLNNTLALSFLPYTKAIKYIGDNARINIEEPKTQNRIPDIEK